MSIADCSIDGTPVAVIDVETTGLTPGFDRIVELSVVRVEPDGSTSLVLDTLVNPRRRMAATEVHGITDADVQDAPAFSEIAGNLLAATQGCVVASYNVYFDIRFLAQELAEVRVAHQAPHFCLMYMRPMLGLGPRCKLAEACRAMDVPYQETHVASDDATAASQLYVLYRASERTLHCATSLPTEQIKNPLRPLLLVLYRPPTSHPRWADRTITATPTRKSCYIPV